MYAANFAAEENSLADIYLLMKPDVVAEAVDSEVDVVDSALDAVHESEAGIDSVVDFAKKFDAAARAPFDTSAAALAAICAALPCTCKLRRQT